MALFKRCKCPDKTKCRHNYYYEFELHGLPFKRSTRTANRQQADRIAGKDRGKALDEKEGLTKAELKPCQLSQLIADYEEHVKEHQTTWEKTAKVLARFLKFVGDQRVTDISPFLINKWKLSRAKEVTQSTVNREMNVLRGLFTQAIVWKKLLTHPMNAKIEDRRLVEDFDVDDNRIRVFDDDELRAVLGAADEAAVLMARVTLLSLNRISEVRLLRREHLGPSWMEVRRKGGKVHRVTLDGELRAALLKRCHKSGYVFGGMCAKSQNVREKGEPPSEQAASQRVRRMLQAVGVLDGSHHTFRHTGVTLMLEDGVNPRAIQTLAGWSSLRMLERYGHARDAELQRAVSGNAEHLATLSGVPPKSPPLASATASHS